MSTPSGGGSGRRARLDRLPAPAIFVLTAAILFGIGAGTRLLDRDVDATALVLRGVIALVIAGPTAGHGAAAGWLLVAIVVVLGAVALIRTEQVLPRIQSLRSQLDARR